MWFFYWFSRTRARLARAQSVSTVYSDATVSARTAQWTSFGFILRQDGASFVTREVQRQCCWFFSDGAALAFSLTHIDTFTGTCETVKQQTGAVSLAIPPSGVSILINTCSLTSVPLSSSSCPPSLPVPPPTPTNTAHHHPQRRPQERIKQCQDTIRSGTMYHRKSIASTLGFLTTRSQFRRTSGTGLKICCSLVRMSGHAREAIWGFNRARLLLSQVPTGVDRHEDLEERTLHSERAEMVRPCIPNRRPTALPHCNFSAQESDEKGQTRQHAHSAWLAQQAMKVLVGGAARGTTSERRDRTTSLIPEAERADIPTPATSKDRRSSHSLGIFRLA